MQPARRVPGLLTAAVVLPVALTTLLPGCASGQEVVDLRTLDLPEWKLEEEFRLGSVNGEYDAFVRPSWLEVDAQGRLYVLDPGLPVLRVFDPAGDYLRQIGHKGQGPGEYTRPVGFGFLGDTIWIVDGVSRRVAFLRMDGNVLEDFTLAPERPGMAAPQPFIVFGPDDFLVVIPPGPDRFLSRSHGVGRVTFQQSLVRRNRSGTRADTLATYTQEAGLMITQADAEGFSIVPYNPIRQLPAFSYHPEQQEIIEVERPVATDADAGEFHIKVRRTDGTVLADRRFRYQPIALPESVKDSIRDDMRSRFEADRARDARAGQKRTEVAVELLDLPDFLPPVSSGVGLGEDGARWISREAFPGVTPPRYLITDSALNPVATLELPPAVLHLIGPRTRESVWVVEKDELDVQYLVRYRIIRN